MRITAPADFSFLLSFGYSWWIHVAFYFSPDSSPRPRRRGLRFLFDQGIKTSTLLKRRPIVLPPDCCFVYFCLDHRRPYKHSTSRHTYDMHLIFRVDEVAQLICRSLSDLGAMGSLASLACTCRALEEPALCTVWGDDGGIMIVTVLKTLPQSIWVLDDGVFVRSHPTNPRVVV
jgi:hypothetical protein